MKFTDEGGRIDVVDPASRMDRSKSACAIPASASTPEFLPHVFDRFRQADSTTTRRHGGVGLGLSIARQLVEAHQGSISVDSEGKDRGSTFIVLPPGVSGRADTQEIEAIERTEGTRSRSSGWNPRIGG